VDGIGTGGGKEVAESMMMEYGIYSVLAVNGINFVLQRIMFNPYKLVKETHNDVKLSLSHSSHLEKL